MWNPISWLLLIWWAGMAPAAWIAGRMWRTSEKPPSDMAVLIFILAWPLMLLAAPAVFLFMLGKFKRKKGAKRGDAKQ